MHPLIAAHVPAIHELCRSHGVRSLSLFGSGARPDFDPDRSDIDLLVEFADRDLGPWMKRFFEFRSALHAILQRPVDLHLASALRASRVGAFADRASVPLFAAV